MHSCMNCVHYDASSAAKCTEPGAGWVNDRSAQNDCHFFEFRSTKSPAPSSNAPDLNEAEAAKKAFRALFRT